MKALLPWGLRIWFLFTLPLVLAMGFSEYSRFTLIQTVTHWRGKFQSIPYVFIGDSITAAGRNWSRLTWQPFAVRNLAAGGYMIRQVAAQIGTAATYRPKYIIALAGTNDVQERRTTEQITADYALLLDALSRNRVKAIITLIPYESSGAHAEAISNANRAIKQECERRGIAMIDLNPTIAPEGKLLVQFTVDGIHPSDAMIRLWADAITRTLKALPGAD